MQSTTPTPNVARDTKTMVTQALDALHDAQLSMQRTALDTARTTIETTMALQRAGLQAFTRAVETSLKMEPVNQDAFTSSVRGFVNTLPGMTPQTAEKIAKDVAAAYSELAATAEKTTESVRVAAQKGATQYEAFLKDLEGRSRAGFETLGEGAKQATDLASRVTTSWVDAFFQAVEEAAAVANKTMEPASVPPK